MKKNIMFGSILTAVLLLGAGCGGGSSSDTDTEESTSAEVSVDKTGYYLDSAVMGVEYHCASHGENAVDANLTVSEEDNTSVSEDDNTTTSEDDNTSVSEDDNTTTEKLTLNLQKIFSGSTSADGSFTYQEGQTCTFSVGGVVLREINTSTMEENIVFEDNITTAQFLQTLDNDGNPENGIQIDAAVASAIASGEIDLNGEVPQTEEELTELVTTLQEKVSTYEGQVVDKDTAKSHLDDTRSSIDAMGGHMNVSAEAQAEGSANEEVEGTQEHPITPTSTPDNGFRPESVEEETPMGINSSEDNETSSTGSVAAEVHVEASADEEHASSDNTGSATTPRPTFR